MTDKDSIIVTETVDGVPIEDATRSRRTPRKKKNTGKDQPSRGGDVYIWGIYLFLVVISVIELYSASSSEVTAKRLYGPLFVHLRWLVLGFIVILFFQRIHYKWFRRFAQPVAWICLGLVVYASFFGARINDAQRAIMIGELTVQPAEMIKLALVIWLAQIMAKNQMSGGVTTKGVIISAIVVVIFSGSVFRNGMTNMLLLMAVSVCMFIIGGIQWRKLGVLFLVYLVCGGAVLMVHFQEKDDSHTKFAQGEMVNQQGIPLDESNKIDRSSTQKGRIEAWRHGLHPGDTIDDSNTQAMHAQFAIARGGVTGNGLGNSRESARLPLAFTDFIYSIVVEDLGFWGGVMLIVVYMMLVVRAGVVASKCTRAFPALLIMGCAVMISFQALVHMGIVTGLFPVSGQPLPFISKGGTSILVMSAALGIMLSVSRYAVRSDADKKTIKKELNDLPDDLRADNPLMRP